MSALDGGVRTLTAVLRVEGTEHAVVSAHVTEPMQGPTHARVIVACDDEPSFSRKLAGAAVLTLSLDGVVVRRFVLRLAQASFLGREAATRRYVLDLYAPLWLLSLAIDTRKFRDATTQAIVSQTLDRFSVPHLWRLSTPTPNRPWCAQYDETCLDFVERLLEHEGIFSATDDEGTLILGDTSQTLAEASPSGIWELADPSVALAHDEAIHALRRGAKVTSGAASVNDHAWMTPAVPLLARASAEVDGDLETYEYPAGYRTQAEGLAIACRRVEEQRCMARFVEGGSNVLAFAAGKRITLGPTTRLAGHAASDWTLVKVEHELANETKDGITRPTYRNRFVAIPRAVPFRPERRTKKPRVEGCHTAMVRGPSGSEIHTDRHGRFKAQFHWDRAAEGTDRDSRWMRMLQESASSMTLARVGWEVSVGYVAGDPDRPIGLARHINGEMTPTYAQPARKNVMTARTPSSPASGGFNELRLDDTKGAMGFHLRAEKDLLVQVKNDKSERVGRDESHFVGGGFQHAVGHDQKVTIGKDSITEVNAPYQLQVGHDRKVTVGASEHVEVGDGAQTQIAKSDSEKVGSMRLTIAGGVGPPSAKSLAKSLVPSPSAAAHSVGMSMAKSLMGGGGLMQGAQQGLTGLIPHVPSVEGLLSMFLQGSIKRSAQKSVSRTVGGAFIAVAVQPIAVSAGLGYVETIGGAKISLSGGNITREAAAVITTVGGLIVRNSTKAQHRTAKTSATVVGATATFQSAVEASLEGKSIVIEAASSVTISCGDSKIVLDSSSIAISGNLQLVAGSSIATKGAKVDLTTA